MAKGESMTWRQKSLRSVARLLVSVLLLESVLPVSAWAHNQSLALRIIVVAGEEISQSGVPGRVQELVVQVQDISTGPISGASVRFSLPDGGGEFDGGLSEATRVTDAQGLAQVGFRPDRPGSQVRIQMEAVFGDDSVRSELVYGRPVESPSGSKKWLWIGLASIHRRGFQRVERRFEVRPVPV